MTISVKHIKVSTIPDSADPTQIQGTDWNNEHVLNCSSGYVLGRQSSGTGAVEEISISSLGASYARRHEYAAPYDYCGKAAAGSSESASVWTIVRLTLSGAVLTATGTATGVAWSNRSSVTYT